MKGHEVHDWRERCGSSLLERWSVDVQRHLRIKSVSIGAASARRKSHPKGSMRDLHNTDGRRQNVNICLVDDMVPDHNIRMLNDCVDAGEHSRND
jgi:hypothetical protein